MLDSRILLALLLLLPAPIAMAQDAEEPVSSRWMLPDLTMLGNKQTAFSDGTVVDWGNPRWGRWASDNAARVERLSVRDLEVWLSICANYRVESTHRTLTRMAEHAVRMRMGPTDLHGTMTASGYVGFRMQVIRAMAMTASERSARDLHTLMQFESRIQSRGLMENSWADGIARAYCAAALTMLDDDRGRDFLIAGYREYLIAIKQSPQIRTECRDVLEGVYDAELIRRIEALLEDPQIIEDSAQNNINGLLEKMRMNGKSSEELFAILREPGDDYNQRKRRNNALHAMALAGTPNDIEDLRGLDLGDDRGANRLRDRAIEQIGCRHWQSQ